MLGHFNYEYSFSSFKKKSPNLTNLVIPKSKDRVKYVLHSIIISVLFSLLVLSVILCSYHNKKTFHHQARLISSVKGNSTFNANSRVITSQHFLPNSNVTKDPPAKTNNYVTLKPSTVINNKVVNKFISEHKYQKAINYLQSI